MLPRSTVSFFIFLFGLLFPSLCWAINGPGLAAKFAGGHTLSKSPDHRSWGLPGGNHRNYSPSSNPEAYNRRLSTDHPPAVSQQNRPGASLSNYASGSWRSWTPRRGDASSSSGWEKPGYRSTPSPAERPRRGSLRSTWSSTRMLETIDESPLRSASLDSPSHQQLSSHWNPASHRQQPNLRESPSHSRSSKWTRPISVNFIPAAASGTIIVSRTVEILKVKNFGTGYMFFLQE
ncbi:hypothetical protein L249_0897 [Ophiocordyceps polyrhachis-furcata BCC 54312]|uniref:Uncharacterized protein n=1 Tax=Ophiocordyceps polyrhachis-furcata BCC 54312 TaxID=1330021 RepID=A0A367LEG1_9HYPO|nr:hypothetical protein L249_0897 [Ophiocordyceps polyrhachis-furcata BCC 54312]